MKHFHNFSFYMLHFSFALACLHANADPSYYAVAHTDNYSADKSAGSDASKALYSGYYCTAKTATELFGGYTASAISSYFSESYDQYMEAKDYGASDGVTAFDSVSHSDGAYALLDYVGSAFSGTEYIALAFYASGTVNAFQVFDVNDTQLTPNGQLLFENSGSGTLNTWQKAPEQENVPEPTSGLLALIGLSALALRRRRA